MPRYVLDPDRLTKYQQYRIGTALKNAGTPQALLEPITVTIDPDGSAYVEYEASAVLSPEEVREISDIIYLHSEQRNPSNEQE